MTFLSVEDTAKQFGVSSGTIYRMIQDDEIQHIKIRGCVRVPETAIDNFIQENLTGGPRGETGEVRQEA